jgi:predicted transposase YdaD
MTDTNTDRTTDYDSPWKIALDGYFKEFLELLFPHIPSEIDWRQGYTSLDKELQQVTPDANSGRRYADKLVKVHTLEGHETWVLIHVEVQGEPEDAFAQRMYTYKYRLRDRYGVDVVSLAVLADTSPGFRPAAFNYDRWGCALQFNVIDWMIQLPSSLNEAFLNTIYAIEEDKNMPYINTAERVGLEKGRHEGELIGIQKGRVEGRMEGRLETMRETALGLLELKFGELPDWATQMINQADATKLDAWTRGVLTAESLEALLGKH